MSGEQRASSITKKPDSTDCRGIHLLAQYPSILCDSHYPPGERTRIEKQMRFHLARMSRRKGR